MIDSPVLVEVMQMCRISECSRVYRVRTADDRRICPDCERLIKLGIEEDPDECGGDHN